MGSSFLSDSKTLTSTFCHSDQVVFGFVQAHWLAVYFGEPIGLQLP